MAVACYARVSTENQLENYSIEEQTERLKLYCKSKDYKIYDMYIDGGYSGGNMQRPALQKLLSDVQSGKINAVLVYKLDRLSRSQKDTLNIIEDHFLKNGVDFISLNENFDTSTPFGKAMIGILSVFAQLEKDQITERFTMGRIGRSKAGYYHGGPTAPTGYDYKDGKLIVNPVTSQQVQEVYREFLNGKSINSIQRQMHEKYGGWGSATLVLNVLKNSVYIGMVKFKGVAYPGLHTPIISREQFERVQQYLNSEERESRKTTAQKTPFKAGFTLSGLVFCKRCGAKFSAEHGNYTCYSRSKSSPKRVIDPNCKNDKWKISDLDELIFDEIEHMSIDDDRLNQVVSSVKQPSAVDEASFQAEIEKIDQQIKRLLDLYQIGTLPISEISERVHSLQVEKEKLENQAKENRRQMSVKERIERFKQLVSQIQYMRTQSVEKKRIYVAELIETIYIDGKEVSINWRI